MHIFNVARTPKYSSVRAARAERGQAMFIIALGIIGLIAFIGLMVDSGILFISNGHLRRAVDAAALSAATQLREGAAATDLAKAAKEFMVLNGVDPDTVIVETCDYQAVPPTPAGDLCPDPPRKFVRVTASQDVRFAFLPIIGFGTFPISADATSEAASVDAVIVIDTSESMCAGNPDWPNCPGVYDPNGDSLTDQDPGPGVYTGCNPTQLNNPTDGAGKCHPLWDAKFAAKAFVKRLYDGYDRIAVIHFDYKPTVDYALDVRLGVDDTPGGLDCTVWVSGCATYAYQAIDKITLHDDAPAPGGLSPGQYDPLNIDCIAPGTMPACTVPTEKDAGGTPKSVLSTCGGCGIRVASSLLKATGRPSALWVIIFLSDGATNLSDFPNDTYLPVFRSNVPPEFPNGFCPGQIGGVTNNPLWGLPYCTDGGFGGNSFISDPTTRHCGPYHLDGASTCPPNSIYVGIEGYTTTVPGGYYDVEDYARDFTDFAALTVNCKDKKPGGEQCTGTGTDKYNQNEKLVGANMAIYSIALGVAANPPNYAGEELLRYMAAVGDDGDRVTDLCAGVAHQSSCGNYYYAPSGGQLIGIFEDIAKRIFTRLTK